MSSIEVAGLYVYPIKSCGRISFEEAEITPRGLKYDRDFMLVDAKNKFVSQRTKASLAAVQPEIIEESGTMHIYAKRIGFTRGIEIPLQYEPDDSQLVEATLHKNIVTGQDVGPTAAEYFSEYLNMHVRLLKVREDIPRKLKPNYLRQDTTDTTGFADGTPMLLTSYDSLEELDEHTQEPTSMFRFRPNIPVVGFQGELPAYDEDYWRRLAIGRMIATVVGPSARCAMIDVDPTTGERDGTKVRDGLRQTRAGVDPLKPDQEEIFFGQGLAHIYKPGLTVAVGDKVTILERDTERNIQLNSTPF